MFATCKTQHAEHNTPDRATAPTNRAACKDEGVMQFTKTGYSTVAAPGCHSTLASQGERTDGTVECAAHAVPVACGLSNTLASLCTHGCTLDYMAMHNG